LLNALEEFDLPPDFVPPEKALSELTTLLKSAQQNRKKVLGNGLEDDENRELLLTSDVHTAVRRVKRGLSKVGMFPAG
jgi:hypothetical protein